MKNSIFKTGWFLLFAAGLLAVMSACKKENTTSELRAVMNDFANSNQKAYIDPEQYSCFVIGEEMRVNNSDGTVSALTRNDRQCTIDNVPVSDGSSLKAFYPKKLLTTESQSKDLSNGFSNVAVYFPPTQECRRDANGNQIIDNPMIAELSGFGSENNTLHFNNVCALLKLTVCTRSSFDAIRVTMGSTVQLWGNGTISGGKVVMDGNSGNSTVILSISGHTSSPTGEAFYIMIPEVQLSSGETIKVEFMNNSTAFKTYTLSTSSAVTLGYNKIHTLGVFTFNAAMFSVSANQKVMFSPGNLQWSYTGGGTTPTTHSINGTGYNNGTWRFAPHQYDVIGAGNESVNLISNNSKEYPATSYNGWIDLFPWGGSGYGTSRPFYYVGTDYNYCRNSYLGDYDWGAFNTIYNPKTKVNDPYGTWRTLSPSEWQYLLYDRGSSNWWRYNIVSVDFGSGDTKYGLIIYPDSITSKPAGVNSWLAVNLPSNCYNISREDYFVLEEIGCAFLPTAGRIIKTLGGFSGDYNNAFYWSNSSQQPNYNYVSALEFRRAGYPPTIEDNTTTFNVDFLHFSVRLVRDVR